MASLKYKDGGREVIVVDVPVKKVGELAKLLNEENEDVCKMVSDEVQTGMSMVVGLLYQSELKWNREYLNSKCNPAYTADVDWISEILSVRRIGQTRYCYEEKELSQFVCMEIKVSGDEIAMDEWKDLRPINTYFRF